MISFTFSRLAIFLGLCSCVAAAPLNNLEARAGCADGKEAPCICNNALGLRQTSSTLRNNCGNQSFKFTDPSSGTDGTVALVSGNTGNVQCDHIVELQFIADEIAKVPSICTHFTSAASAASFQTFFNAINTPPNTIFVEATVNNAKGVVFGGKSFATTSQKAANGVVSYLTLLKANKATTAADDVNTAMDTAVGAGNGFQAGFQTRFAAAVNSAISTSKTQAPKLAPAPAPGDPFVDETASTIAKCTTRRGVWESVQDFVVRAVTGETVTTAAAACSVPAKTATKPTTQPVTKPAAVPAAKPTLAPAAKPAAAPAAKPAAPAAKPVTAPVAEKPAAKPVAKPVAKPAAKPVAKPAVKPKKP